MNECFQFVRELRHQEAAGAVHPQRGGRGDVHGGRQVHGAGDGGGGHAGEDRQPTQGDHYVDHDHSAELYLFKSSVHNIRNKIIIKEKKKTFLFPLLTLL